jgi:hypothetical protein
MRVAWVALIAGCGFQSQPVGGDSTASSPDASFVTTQCPASYDLQFPQLASSSRYRLVINGDPAWKQSDTCAGDLMGATHLVVLETQDELNAVATLVNAPPLGINANAVWVGGVQPLSAMQPRDGWLGFNGEALFNGWGGGEPNDKGGGEDHAEQFVRIEKGKPYFQDSAGSVISGALCECDGKPIAANAADAIKENSPPSPPPGS